MIQHTTKNKLHGMREEEEEEEEAVTAAGKKYKMLAYPIFFFVDFLSASKCRECVCLCVLYCLKNCLKDRKIQ